MFADNEMWVLAIVVGDEGDGSLSLGTSQSKNLLYA